jgi:serine phosphatase RsbU (regulator of sigma subunit)/putative methionine-R-sulfoxide reductase with GAF domain
VTGDPGLHGEPEWKHLLNLGEQLLELPNAAAQCQLITKTIQIALGCQANVWLARPFYPLPGEPEIPILPDAPAPALVTQALQSGQEGCFTGQQPASKKKKAGKKTDRTFPVVAVAVPILNHCNLLGIVYAERPDGPAFVEPELKFLEGITAHAAMALQISRQITIKNWRQEQLALVRKVNTQIANLVDLDTLCSRVTELIQRTFKYYFAAIFTLEQDSETLLLRGSNGIQPVASSLPIQKIRVGEGIVGLVAQDGVELLAPDVKVEPSYRFLDALSETQSEVALPLKIEDRVLGILDVQSNHLDGFHEMDMLVLRSLADNVALAIDSARLYTSLQQRADQMSAVSEIGHALNSILDTDDLLEEVVHLIHKRFNHPYVHLYTVHPGRRKIIYRAGSGIRSQKLKNEPVMYDLDDPEGIIPYVGRTGNTLLANDVTREPHYRPSHLPPFNTQSELAIPLIYAGDLLGVLDIQSDRLNAFSDNDRNLYETLGASIAISIRNASLYRTEKWRHQVAESFKDVANLISSNIPLDKLLDTILRELERNLPCEASAIWLLDEANPSEEAGDQHLHLAAVHGINADQLQTLFLDNTTVRNWLNQAALSPQPLIRRADEQAGPLGTALQFPPDHSSIAAPLLAGEQCLGVITLAHHSPGRYGSEARDMTTTFASYAAVAIQNARLFTEAQEQAWVSTVLLQVSDAIKEITSIDELFSTLVRLIPVLVGVEKCATFLWDESQQGFILKNWYGSEVPPENRIFYEDQAPAFSHLKETGETLFIQDAVGELAISTQALQPAPGILVLLPLLTHGNVIGAILVDHLTNGQENAKKAIEDRVLSLLQGIAHQAAITLENLRLIESNQEEAYVTAVLLQVAQAAVSQNELPDILETIVQLMPILVGIDACVIYLWDGPRKLFYPAQVLAETRQQEEELALRSYGQNEFNLLSLVFNNNQFYLCELPDAPPVGVGHWAEIECLEPDHFNSSTRPVAGNWLMGFPLSVKGDVFGVMVAKQKGLLRGLQDRRLEIINGIAQQTALAIQNDHVKQERVERERVNREFSLAREIQETFLPAHLPVFPGWEIDTRWQTARQVGGDFYDIFRLSGDRVGLVIADVSDKGMPAALYMTVTRTLIRANISDTRPPSAVLEKVNRQLHTSAPNSMFITVVYAIISLKTGEMTYCNAGHNRPILVRAASGKTETLLSGGSALGVFEKVALVDHAIALDAGDKVLFYTDGVTESISPTTNALFGEDRLDQVVASATGQGVCSLLDSLDQALLSFRESSPPSDDVTLLAIQRLP